MQEQGQDGIDEIAAITDPAERAVRLKAIARERGTLSAAESVLYRSTIAELRGNRERHRAWIADLLKISPGAVSRLLRTKKSEVAA